MESIGYIEVVGLSSAIVVSDKMLKTAAVSIRNVENTRGGGYITVSVSGDVAAVEAAIDAGKNETSATVVSSVVIANPAEGIPELGKTDAFKDQAPFTTYGDADDQPDSTAPKQPAAKSTTTDTIEKAAPKRSTRRAPKTKTTRSSRTQSKNNQSNNQKDNPTDHDDTKK